jgi:hypothetical protein
MAQLADGNAALQKPLVPSAGVTVVAKPTVAALADLFVKHLQRM